MNLFDFYSELMNLVLKCLENSWKFLNCLNQYLPHQGIKSESLEFINLHIMFSMITILNWFYYPINGFDHNGMNLYFFFSFSIFFSYIFEIINSSKNVSAFSYLGLFSFISITMVKKNEEEETKKFFLVLFSCCPYL